MNHLSSQDSIAEVSTPATTAPCSWRGVLGVITALTALTGCVVDGPSSENGVPPYESPIFFGSPVSVHGGLPPVESNRPDRLPRWARSGQYVVGAHPHRGLVVLEASEPDSPQVVGELPLAGTVSQLLVEPKLQITLVIQELPELAQESPPPPRDLEAVTRLVRYDASVPASPERVADVAICGDFWSLVQRGNTYWAMSERQDDGATSCTSDRCGSGNGRAMVLTAFELVDGVWQEGQQLELPLTRRAWATPGGFATFESETGDYLDCQEGNLHVASFEESGRLAPPKVVALEGAPAEHAPLDLSTDQLRVFVDLPSTDTIELQLHDIGGEETTQLSSVVGLTHRLGRGTHFTRDAVYVSDEAFGESAVFIDLSDPAAPRTVPFPPAVSVVWPLPATDEATTDGPAHLLGWGVDVIGDELQVSLLEVDGESVSVAADLATDWRPPFNEDDPMHADGIWVEDGRVLSLYRGGDNATYATGVVYADSQLRQLVPAPVGSAQEIVPVGDWLYAPDRWGLTVAELDTGSSESADWVQSVGAYVPAGDFTAALVAHRGGLHQLELDGSTGSMAFDVPPAATHLLPADTDVLVATPWPSPDTDDVPILSIFELGDPPAARAEVPFPELPVVAPSELGQTDIAWDEFEIPPQRLADGRWVFSAQLEVTCWSEEDCAALGIEAKPLTEIVLLPEDHPPSVDDGSALESPPVPTAYGCQRRQVFHVLNLEGTSGPHFGPPGISTVELGDSQFGPVVVSGQTVLATRMEFETGRERGSRSVVEARFMLDRLVADSTGAFDRLEPVNVPGFPLALVDDGAILLTVEPLAGGADGAMLHRLALDGATARILQSRRLEGCDGRVALVADVAFCIRQLDADECEGSVLLQPIALDDEFTLLPALELPGPHWWIADTDSNQLLLRGPNTHSFALVDVADDGTPRMAAFRSIAGWWEPDDLQLVEGAVWGALGLDGRQKIVF